MTLPGLSDWEAFLADLEAEAQRQGLPPARDCECLYGPLRGRHSLDGSHPELDAWVKTHPLYGRWGDG